MVGLVGTAHGQYPPGSADAVGADVELMLPVGGLPVWPGDDRAVGAVVVVVI